MVPLLRHGLVYLVELYPTVVAAVEGTCKMLRLGTSTLPVQPQLLLHSVPTTLRMEIRANVTLPHWGSAT